MDAGIVDPVHLRQIAALHRNCENMISTNWTGTDDVCGNMLSYVSQMSKGVNNYDATIFNYDIDPVQAPY